MEPENKVIADGLGCSDESFGPIVNTPGHNGVDFETRVDFERLRAYRLARAREALEKSDLAAILLFDFTTFVTSRKPGLVARSGQDVALLPLNAVANRWCGILDQRRAITNSSRRGWNRTTVGRNAGSARSDRSFAGLFESAVKEIVGVLNDQGLLVNRGIDIVELPFLFEMQSAESRYATLSN